MLVIYLAPLPRGFLFGLGAVRHASGVRHALQCSPVMSLILCAFATNWSQGTSVRC